MKGDGIVKKLIRSFTALTLLLLGISFTFNDLKVKAATSSWQSVTGISGCKVRVWTDYTAYTSSADTINSYLESNGYCGRLEYENMIAQQEGNANFYSRDRYSGYFSNQTPTKLFNLNNFTGKFYSTTDVKVYALVWKDGKKSSTATLIESLPLTIYKR